MKGDYAAAVLTSTVPHGLSRQVTVQVQDGELATKRGRQRGRW
jgi:hypothetical protein